LNSKVKKSEKENEKLTKDNPKETAKKETRKTQK